MLKFNIALDETGQGTVTVFDNDDWDFGVQTIDQSHPNFLKVIDAVVKGDDPTDLLDVAAAVIQLDERVSIVDGEIFFDGEPVHNQLSATILRYNSEHRDTTGLVKFMERLARNPSFRSREQLFQWTTVQSLVIDSEGYFIGYKGVTRDLKSIHSGGAMVNGIQVDGAVPNKVGSVISMDRSKVQDDPNIGCSHGLHVGAWDYARNFGHGTVLEVRVDPADVVSVPTECGLQKLRCCKYEVLAIHETGEDDIADTYEPDGYDEDWDDEDFLDEFERLVPAEFLDRLRERFAS